MAIEPPDTASEFRQEPDSDIVGRTTYQFFMISVTFVVLAITVAYYLVPLPETVRQVLYILDSLFSPILLYDFLVHTYYARNRSRYLMTYGWLDFLGSLPGAPVLRLARLPGLVLALRKLLTATPGEARRLARQRLAESALLAVTLIVVIVVTVGSILIVLVEAPVENANIKTGNDAVWWSIVTVSTVGYGDRFPVTDLGRLIGTLMIVMGVSLFSVLTSYVATQFMARRKAIGPSEVELLRIEMVKQFEAARTRELEENAVLQRKIEELRASLDARPQ